MMIGPSTDDHRWSGAGADPEACPAGLPADPVQLDVGPARPRGSPV
ncbi:hypothetical protein TOK_3578 [Pseudonocardia sp. N23]|nr:hypothetical protein TOK_3578 [Pseudonocardia sp. N23]